MNLRYPSIANHNQFWPIMTSSGQSMPILTNLMPTQGQSDVNLSPQPIRPICQSLPILDYPCQSGTTRCQSRTNHMPIQCHSDAIQGHSLDQSRINLIQFCQSSTNPVPIPCHFWIQHQFSNFQNLSISANPSRSMPIHCQFFLATQVLNSAEFARFEPI